jgi:DNA-binding CsgD family transcriptional regulator
MHAIRTVGIHTAHLAISPVACQMPLFLLRMVAVRTQGKHNRNIFFRHTCRIEFIQHRGQDLPGGQRTGNIGGHDGHLLPRLYNIPQAIRHIDRALALALPDKFYGLLAEYYRTLGPLLEMRLKAIDEAAWNEVNRLYKSYAENWSKLGSKVTGRQLVEKLSVQYREVARLAAFKLSDAEIAVRTNMSVSGVKQAIRIIKQKSGLERADFAAIL